MNKSYKDILKEIGNSAKEKAYDKKLPVAISENGKTVLVFPDGTKKPYNKNTIKSLSSNIVK